MCGGFQPVLGSFKLIHDHSKVIERSRKTLLMIDRMPDLADPTKLQRGIGVKEVVFGDSKTHAQLQIADWVAGFTKDVAAIKWGKTEGAVDPVDAEMAEGWLAAGPLAPDPEVLAKLGISPGP